MMKCDKQSEDPAKHFGPFEHLRTYEDGGQKIAAEECAACGNVVLLNLPKDLTRQSSIASVHRLSRDKL